MTLNRTAVAAACAWLAVHVVTTTARGDCVPGTTFAYGPAFCPVAEQLAIEMEGPDGGLQPDPTRVVRVQRGLGLLQQAVPAIHPVPTSALSTNIVMVQLPAPGQVGDQVQCLNDYFQVTGFYPHDDAWMLVAFPYAVNPWALAQVYLSTGQIIAAGPYFDEEAGCVAAPTIHLCAASSRSGMCWTRAHQAR